MEGRRVESGVRREERDETGYGALVGAFGDGWGVIGWVGWCWWFEGGEMGGEGERARRLYESGKAALAARFDAGRGLIRAETDLGVFHLTRESLGYARCLLRDSAGGDADAALGARIVDGVLAVQERQPGEYSRGEFSVDGR